MPEDQGSYDLDFEGSFLADLPPSIKRYTCHGKQHLINIFDSEPFDSFTDASKFLLFHASEKTIESIVGVENEDSWLPKNPSSFDTQEQLLLVKMSSMPHSVASHSLNTCLLDALAPIGMSGGIQGYNGLTVRNQGRPRGKVADYAWGPLLVPPGQPRSPSVTLEVAYSETDSKLNSDVRFWLNPEDGNADVCLTLRINRDHPEIRIEKWERQNSRPHRSQVIWITRSGNRVHVNGHPLEIPFESLFRRRPAIPEERDPQISQQQLEDIANRIWIAQEF